MSGMKRDEIQAILDCVKFPGYTFIVVNPGYPVALYLQAEFMAPCNHAGGAPELQKTRKWQLSEHMTKSEVVQTAFKCVLTSLEHEAREQFTYRHAAIFGPHFDVEDLVYLVRGASVDVRPAPPPRPTCKTCTPTTIRECHNGGEFCIPF